MTLVCVTCEYEWPGAAGPDEDPYDLGRPCPSCGSTETTDADARIVFRFDGFVRQTAANAPAKRRSRRKLAKASRRRNRPR